jgi:hypothetical protein
MRNAIEAEFCCSEVARLPAQAAQHKVTAHLLRPELHWADVIRGGRRWRYFNKTLSIPLIRRSATEYTDTRSQRVFVSADPAQPEYRADGG